MITQLIAQWSEVFPNAKQKLFKIILVFGQMQPAYQTMIEEVKKVTKDLKVEIFDDLPGNMEKITDPKMYKRETEDQHSVLILG